MSISAKVSIDQLTQVLDGLYGCKSKATEMESAKPIDDPMVVATYNDTEGELKFLMICELKLANSLGAALTMIPPGGAEEASDAGIVPENVSENLYEVFNICSSIFSDIDKNRRILVEQMITPGQEKPAGLSETLTDSQCLLQVEYELDRYQSGLLSLLQVS